MNLVKAADDIKNLSDQQLLAAGQNPVMVPPYLVLAEMKRREQIRAQFAKAQQQQQQPSVAQQVAQNLSQPQMQQGQPQGQPQQAPPQGIMQAAPPQAMAMAQGGHVARYAEGGSKSGSSFDSVMAAFRELLPKQPTVDRRAPAAPTTEKDLLAIYPKTSPADFMSTAEQLYGKPDYSKEEQLIARQRQLAEAKRPRIGDALIAAGAAMAANRDPRVGLASLMAQGIGVGSQAYQASKEQREKDLNAAMLAEIALNKMKQEDTGKKAKAAFDLYQADRGERITRMQILEAAKAREIEQYNRAVDEESRRKHAVNLSMIEASQRQALAEFEAKSRRDAALISASRAYAPSRQGVRQVAEEKALGLAQDALMQAEDWLGKNPDVKSIDVFALTLKNLSNPKYFQGYDSADRLRAANYVRMIKSKQDQDKARMMSAEAAMRRAQGPDLAGIMGAGAGQPGSMGPTDYYTQAAGDAISLGARPLD